MTHDDIDVMALARAAEAYDVDLGDWSDEEAKARLRKTTVYAGIMFNLTLREAFRPATAAMEQLATAITRMMRRR